MRTLSLLLLALVGCGPASISGEVDGQRVGGARDAFYDTFEIDLGPFGQLDVITIWIADFAESCDVFDDFFDTIEPVCDDRCDEYAEIADEYHLTADEYWTLAMTANADHGFDTVYDYDEDFGEDEFVATYSEWDTEPLHDDDLCEDECQDGDLLVSDDEDGEDGELEITSFDDGEVITGKFEIDFGGNDVLKGSFHAQPCRTSDWLNL